MKATTKKSHPYKKGYELGLREKAGHKHFIMPLELVEIAKERFVLEKTYSYPLPGSIGKYFAHNKEVVIFRKV